MQEKVGYQTDIAEAFGMMSEICEEDQGEELTCKG